MKNYLLLLSMLVLASACKKTVEPNHQPTNYRIDNITAIRLDANKGYNALLQYDLVSTGPVQETVTLSFEGLPDGIVMDTSNTHLTRSGIPGFTASVHLMNTDTLNREGSYKVRLVSTGSVTGSKYYNVELKVSAPKQRLLGAPDACRLDTTVYDDLGNQIVFHPWGVITFNGFGDHSNWNFEMSIDCDGNFDLSNIYPASDAIISYGRGSFSMEKDRWMFIGDMLYTEYRHSPPLTGIYISIPL